MREGLPFANGKGMFHRRLGMFIHWGVYSVGGWHEQELFRRRMSRVEYEAAFPSRFTGDRFDAGEFVDVAASAGAEYIVFTAKHHDGFCMWDTKTTDYKVTNTPLGRDVVRELADACQARGMRLGLYYSNPDWHHPNARNGNSTHQIPLQPGDKPDIDAYVAYMKAQITELLTSYGPLCCWFWDIPTGIERPEMDELVRRLQPGILINDRGWGNGDTCDYSTPERDFDWQTPPGRHVEACDSVGVQSWGYRANEDYRTLAYLVRAIDRYLSCGGNYLLNVGPKPDGTVPDEAKALMRGVGRWYESVRESYHNVENAPPLAQVGCSVTRRGDTLYLHLNKGLDATGFDAAPLDTLPKSAVLLNTGVPLDCELELFPKSAPESAARTLHVFHLPTDALTDTCPVIRLTF